MLRGLTTVTCFLALSVGCTSSQFDHAGNTSGPDLQDLTVRGSVDVSPAGYRGLVTIVNRSSKITRFGVADWSCAVHLVLDATDEQIAWDQRSVVQGRVGGCKWMPSEVELHPADSMVVATEFVRAEEILGDSLAAGAYSAAVRMVFARMVPIPGESSAWRTETDSVAFVEAGEMRLER